MKKFLRDGLLAAVMVAAVSMRAAEAEDVPYAEALPAAKKGDARAMGIVAEALETGTGVDADPAAALNWYRKAADAGYAPAQAWMGAAYAETDYQPRRPDGERYLPLDLKQAAAWWKKAAAQGHAVASYELAGAYAQGEGVETNLLEAYRLYDIAATAEVEYAEGLRNILVHEHPEIIPALVLAAPPEVQALLQKAEGGDAAAQYEVALRFDLGRDGLPPSDEDSWRWMQRAAERGSPGAQVRMAGACEAGIRGFAKSEKEAAKWYRKAADGGSADAMIALGDLYENGRGVEKSIDQAAYWWGQAQAHGNDAGRARREMSIAINRPFKDVPPETMEKMAQYDELAQAGAQEATVAAASGADAAPASAPPAAPALTPAEKLQRARETFAHDFADASDRDSRAAAVRALALAYDENYVAAGLDKDQATRSAYGAVEPGVRQRPAESGFYMVWLNYGYLNWDLLCQLVVSDIGFTAMNRSLSAQNREARFEQYGRQATQGDAAAQYELAQFYLKDEELKNEELGISWLVKAKDAGYKYAVEQAKALAKEKYDAGSAAWKAEKTGEGVRLYALASQLGMNDGAESVGNAYESGWTGQAADYAKALEWYRKAADSGFAGGLSAQAKMYHLGHGVPQDDAEAAKLFRAAAEKGDSSGIIGIGYAYLVGRGVPADEAQAKAWFGKGAARKTAIALQWLKILEPKASPIDRANLTLASAGTTFYEGTGEIFIELRDLLDYAAFLGSPEAKAIAAKWHPLDDWPAESDEMVAAYKAQEAKKFPEALALFIKAAEKGDPIAMRIAATYHLGGYAGVPENLDESQRWFEKAGQAGLVSGWLGSYLVRSYRIFLLGNAAEEKNDMKEALRQWQIAGDMGLANALLAVGNVYEYGYDFVPVDLAEARRNYERSILFNPTLAAGELKRLEARETGRREFELAMKAEEAGDEKAAVAGLEQAMKLGNLDAEEHLAFRYLYGKGVSHDLERAKALYGKAAALGSQTAQETLAAIEANETADKTKASLKNAQKLADTADGKTKPAAGNEEFEDVDQAIARLRELASNQAGYEKEARDAMAARDRINAAAAPVTATPATLTTATAPEKSLSDAELKARAVTGDALAQYDYGERLLKGGDKAAASTWFHKALENPKASAEVKKWAEAATMEERYAAEAAKDKAAKEAAISAKIIQQAAEKPKAPAEQTADDYFSTFRLLSSFGGSKEAFDALQAAAKIAETGSPETRYRLASAIMQGSFGITRDPERGKALFISSAKDGFAAARLAYAQALLTGNLGIPVDVPAGNAMLKEVVANAENEDGEVKHQVAMILFQGVYGTPVDRPRAIKLLGAAAEGGLRESQYEFGRALIGGIAPDLPADPVRGIGLLRKAAEQHVIEAAVILGKVYEQGVGAVAANPSEAYDWYKKAEGAGVAGAKDAMERVRKLIPAPAAPAMAEAQKKAESGDPQAQLDFALVWEKQGKTGEARDWYKKASENPKASPQMREAGKMGVLMNNPANDAKPAAAPKLP